MKKIVLVVLLFSFISYSQDDDKIIYDWNNMVSAKIIEIEKDANKNEYGILNNQFNDKPQINNRDFKILKSLLKFDSTSYDTMKEKRQILLQITFKNEIVIFLLHLNQVTLFDLRPNKFNFIRIFNGEKFKEFISNYLNKNK